MDFSNFTHHGEDGFLTEQRESHWQPALRPNEEEMDHTSPEQALAETHYTIHANDSQSVAQPANHKDDDSIDSDDNEGTGRLDPAWGIKRTDSAHILDTVRRSTSFPRPTIDQNTFSPPPNPWAFSQSQPHSNTEVFTSDDPSDLQSSGEHKENQYGQEPLHSAHQMVTADYDEARDNEPVAPDHEESRFNEGVPLMQETYITEAPEPENTPSALSAFDTVGAEVDEAGFFSQIDPQQPLDIPENPALERKDTEDVLKSLGVQQSTAPDSPPLHPSQGDHRQKDLAAVFAEADDTEDDPWKAVLGDDDEFLVEDADDLLPESDSEPESVPVPSTAQSQTKPAARQSGPGFARSNSNAYAPHQPSTSELAQFGATTHNSIGLPRHNQNPMNAFQAPQQPSNITNRAESYVDQSKGGYKSPYDLPMDLAPKRKAQAPRALPQLNNLPPPPRSSSITDKQLQSPFSPATPSYNQSSLASPVTGQAAPSIDRAASVPVKPQQSNKRNSSGFFEELPIAARVRPSPVPQRAPSAQTPAGPPRKVSNPTSSIVASPPQIPSQEQPQQQDSYAFGLRQPEMLDPYASVALQTAQAAPPPVVNQRYSPAPPSAHGVNRPSPSPRYSPAPPPQVNSGQNRYVSQPVQQTATLPFQPRTSSPLAQNRKLSNQPTDLASQQRPGPHHTVSSSVPYAASFSQAASNTLSPPRVVDPIKQQPDFAPPRRSQTQSPNRQIARPDALPRVTAPPNRPVSAYGQTSPTRTAPPQNILSPPRLISRPTFAEEVDYIKPSDGTEGDPLERWKGTPIVRFGFGGTVVTSFPIRTPRFSSAVTRPQIKVSSGEIHIKKLGEWNTLKDHVKRFPGPLKGKAKKKDVLSWLNASVKDLETEAMSLPSKRTEERILLWKVLRILVEQDGNLSSPQAVQSVSEILMPSVYTAQEPSSSGYRAEDVTPGIYRPASVSAKTETVDPVAVDNLRLTLLKGKREEAVWQAVDNRLWSHALLLASTLEKSVWKQVVQEFVKQEVKTIGANAESLCALYEILGGNLEESIDQLVPPSARAGLQMVSKVDPAGPTRNALDGMDRWRETLCLVLNNRCHEDQRALVTLARLLSDYGRIEAAHICYLFARNVNTPNMFGGADDLNSQIVLLGADHRQQPLTFHNDVDAILLTEVFEFAVSTLASGSAGAPMPHLAVYKLQRANDLTDAGMKTEAQAYCEAIASGLKSSTKHSLYYHPILLGEVEDLSNRLKQIPVQSSSWMAKPSIEKASTSVWNKFSSFVTGEDSDAESKGSARDAAEAGPFAKVSGSPTLSRNTSQTDLYGSYPTMTSTTAPVPAAAAGSRYAPNGMNSTRSSSDLTRGRMSFESQRSPPSTSHSNETRSLYAPAAQPQQSQYSPLGMSPQPTGFQSSPEVHMPPVAEEYAAPQYNSYAPQVAQSVMNGTPMETSNGIPQPSEYSPQPDQDTEPVSASTFEPPQSSYGAYEPPSDSGYVPYQPEPDSDDEPTSKPRSKKSFNDVGDDDYSNVSHQSKPAAPSALTDANDDAADAARRKANDDAAEAAFRAAAEADAQAATDNKASKKASGSWLGGWFGGKKPDSLDSPAPSSKSAANSKVHRVHLGESKMKLYYDENKKKWINPDNPEASEKKTFAPPPRGSTGSVPPPMMGGGGPPRSVSTPHSLPVGGISRSGTPASVAVDSDGGDSRPGSSHMGPGSGFAATLPPGTKESLGLGGTPLPTPPGSSAGPTGAGSAPPNGPPSRPASALSNASGLDDLLGPPTGARKVSGRAAKGKKGRYVDVMAK